MNNYEKILITGSTSKLGVRLIEIGSILGLNLIGVNLSSPHSKYKLDLREKDSVSDFIKDYNPTYLIHLAAITNANYCEDNIDDCMEINYRTTENLAQACNDFGVRMINISSDYVFDGLQGPYSETDSPNPLNQYGKAKLLGEQILARRCSNSVSIRTNVLYDWNENSRRISFLTWLIKTLKKNKKVTIVNDQFSTPTYILQLAKIIIDLLYTDYTGVINVCGSEWINRYHFSVLAAKIFDLDCSLVCETNSSEFYQSAARPLKGGLKVKRIETLLGEKMFDCEQGLNLCKKFYDNEMDVAKWLKKK